MVLRVLFIIFTDVSPCRKLLNLFYITLKSARSGLDVPTEHLHLSRPVLPQQRLYGNFRRIDIGAYLARAAIPLVEVLFPIYTIAKIIVFFLYFSLLGFELIIFLFIVNTTNL